MFRLILHFIGLKTMTHILIENVFWGFNIFFDTYVIIFNPNSLDYILRIFD